jgi:hypothetical protein
MFERLTNPKHGGIRSMRLPLSNQAEIYQRLAAYEDSGLSPDEVLELEEKYETEKSNSEATYAIMCGLTEEVERLKKCLAEYEQAKADERLWILPVKPGDIIYRPEALQYCWIVIRAEIYEDEILFIDDSDNIFRLDDIGKTVFLTYEAAEKALGGKEDEK